MAIVLINIPYIGSFYRYRCFRFPPFLVGAPEWLHPFRWPNSSSMPSHHGGPASGVWTNGICVVHLFGKHGPFHGGNPEYYHENKKTLQNWQKWPWEVCQVFHTFHTHQHRGFSSQLLKQHPTCSTNSCWRRPILTMVLPMAGLLFFVWSLSRTSRNADKYGWFWKGTMLKLNMYIKLLKFVSGTQNKVSLCHCLPSIIFVWRDEALSR